MRGVFLVLLMLVVPAPARPDAVDDYLAAAILDQHLPGLALAVVRDGQVVKTAGYGHASLELRAPVTPRTVFEIGSLTKQFTAAAIMMLVEEGRLSLDDPVALHLGGAPAAWSAITIRHLLSHTSGLKDYLGVPAVLGAFHEDIGHDEVARLFFAGLPLEFAPGETWAYSNSGYLLLGNVVEKASGKTYWRFLEERIFAPLSMTATRSTSPRTVIAGRAAGHEWRGGAFENRRPLGEDASAAGAIVSTVEDLARWDAALRGTKLLKAASLRQMWTANRVAGGAVAPFDYGFGWFVGTHNGTRLVTHSGGTPGFSSVILRFADEGLTIILLTNHADRVLEHLALDVAGLYVPALAPREAAKADPDPATTGRLRAAVLGLIERKPDLAAFTPAMRMFLQTGVGRELYAWAAADGALRSFSFSGSEEDDGTRLLRYRVVLGGVARSYTFRVTSDGQIAQVRWW